MALSQPRQEEAVSSDGSSSTDSDDEDAANAETVESPAVRMMRKTMVFQQEQQKVRDDAIKRKGHNFRLPVCYQHVWIARDFIDCYTRKQVFSYLLYQKAGRLVAF